MTYSKFSDLSLDLKSLIISYITRPTDLKSICLTSRDCRDVAVRELYRKVFLDIGGAKAVRISGFLARENPGLPHVRDITVYFCISGSDDREVLCRQANFVVRLLLELLPPNILEAFRWRTREHFSAENFLLLHKKQKRLQHLESPMTDDTIIQTIRQMPDVFKSMEGVRSVELDLGTLESLEVSNTLLQSATKLDDLSIRSRFGTNPDPPSDLEDSSTGLGLISRTVFGHMRPFENCVPLVLKSLYIDNISLRYVSSSYMRVIKMPALEELAIWECPGADALFAELSKPHQRPSGLKILQFYHHDDGQQDGLRALEGFLQSISGLVTLYIEIFNAQALPKEDCIIRHGASLAMLTLYAQKTDRDVLQYSTGAFDRICTSCTGLRQLSVTSPEQSASNALSSEEFGSFLSSMHKLSQLRTLNLRRWPSVVRGENIFSYGELDTDVLSMYEHLLQRVAQGIFEKADLNVPTDPSTSTHHKPPSRLFVIAFGGNGNSIFADDDKLKQIAFVRGKKVDAFGKATMLAVQMKPHKVKFVEPESEVLSLSRQELNDVI